MFIKRTLEFATSCAGQGREIGPEHLLDGLLEGAAAPVGEELSRGGRRLFKELGGTVGVTSPALLVLRSAGIDADALRQRLSEWL